MTLSELKTKLSRYWIFIFFAAFLAIFILLYLVLNPSQPQPTTIQPPQTSVPPQSQPGTNPFASQPQSYQISDSVRTYPSPGTSNTLTVKTQSVNYTQIASAFGFNSTTPRELPTDLGTRRVFIDQNRTLAIDDLTVTYRNPAPSQPGSTGNIESIKTQALSALQIVTSDPKLSLSEPEFYSTQNPNDQPIPDLAAADLISFNIISLINNLPVSTDRTPNSSVGSISLDRSGTILSFELITADYLPGETINLISTSQAITKLTGNQSTIVQIKQLTGSKDDESTYRIADYKNIQINSVSLSYFFPTVKNPQTLYPFYIFTGIALDNNNQQHQISLAVEAATN